MNTKKIVLIFLVVIGASYLFGIFILGKSQTTPMAPSPYFNNSPADLLVPKGIAISPPNTFSELVKKVKPAVVNIATTKEIKTRSFNPWSGNPFFQGMNPSQGTPAKQEMHSLGTGFIINSKGDILTNNHVIEGADEIVVKLDDGREIEAKIVGRDEKQDLAVIRPLHPDGNFPSVTLGDSDKIDVGDWVVAVGNPFGLGQTVTAGIVSAKARVLGAGPYDDFIQTDASINPGNSGGPLFNTNGEVVGINAAIIASGQGIGFAIPVNIAKEIVPQLISKGSVSRGWLGVAIRDMSQIEATKMGLTKSQGAVVSQVISGGPADQAGIKMGDVILSVQGTDISDSHALPVQISQLMPGSAIKIQFLHEGQKYERDVVLGSAESALASGSAGTEAKILGMSLRDLTSSEKMQTRLNRGVVVTSVDAGGFAESIGIEEGDLLLEINANSVQNVADFQDVFKKIPSGAVVRFGLARGPNMYYFAFRKN